MAADPYEEFRDELVAAGVLLPTGVEGLWGRSQAFETIVEGISRLVTAAGQDDGPEVVRFPPLLSRAVFERTDYLRSFPDLIGSVHGFSGDDRDHAALLRTVESGGDWSAGLTATDVVLLPAACYPVYPLCTGRLATPRRFDIVGLCFRSEPSVDPARMQSFRQHEQVYVGDAEGALAFRDFWVEQASAILRGLGLKVDVDVANDPFFGRAGRMLAANQRQSALKFEVLSPICSDEKPTAIASCNCHQDHFGLPFGIRTADGAPAHSACVGFGLERIALALLRTHGLDPAAWPADVRTRVLGAQPATG